MYSVEDYLAMNNEKMMPATTVWVGSLRALCSVKSARCKDKRCMISILWDSNIHTHTHTKPGLTNTENSLVFAGSGGGGGQEMGKGRTSSYEDK